MVKERGVEVEWRSFELRPEGVEVPERPKEYMERAWANVQRMAARYGLDMKYNPQPKHSRMAHEGAKFAAEQGLSDAYQRAVFAAHFTEDKNIDDLPTLVSIAESIGLDGDAFRDALTTRRFRNDVMADQRLAHEIGITAVPCFIAGERGVLGAQDYETLCKLLDNQLE